MEFGSVTVDGKFIYQVDIIDIPLLHHCLNHFPDELSIKSRIACSTSYKYQHREVTNSTVHRRRLRLPKAGRFAMVAKVKLLETWDLKNLEKNDTEGVCICFMCAFVTFLFRLVSC